VYHKISTFCCPLAILWCNHYYYYDQIMMIDWLKRKRGDNLTPRHLHAYIDDELQNVPDWMCCNFDRWQNWSIAVVDRFLWIMVRFFFSHPSFSFLYWALVVCWLNEQRKTILLSFHHSHFFFCFLSHIHTCQLMVNNTDVNFENFQL
jgi:hypothetical protein